MLTDPAQVLFGRSMIKVGRFLAQAGSTAHMASKVC